ncbi:hypothetical protein BC826DRAFT_153219 [Russula brevipes]|nr:hypothetical protein BC826DRAFT_153219 [Russula brevipes]
MTITKVATTPPSFPRISLGRIGAADTSSAQAHRSSHTTPMFVRIHMPRVDYDVYAAISVDGTNEIDADFDLSVVTWSAADQARTDGYPYILRQCCVGGE